MRVRHEITMAVSLRSMGGEGTPEAAAAALLASAGLGELEAPPIDVTSLAEEHEGLDVQEHVDLRTLADSPTLSDAVTLSGLLIPARRRIWVDAVEAKRSPGRRSFTIAHELGHWCMHREGTGTHTRFCRADEVGASPAELHTAVLIERQANRFAAALLMPEEILRREAERSRLSVPLLARRFGVSGAAMQVRLEVLGLIPDYMHR